MSRLGRASAMVCGHRLSQDMCPIRQSAVVKMLYRTGLGDAPATVERFDQIFTPAKSIAPKISRPTKETARENAKQQVSRYWPLTVA
jgi:hypothetical protein